MSHVSADDSVIERIQLIRNLRQAAEWKRDAWLRARGWESTCETPGSLWMWRKLWNGRDGKTPVMILTDATHAEHIQAEWDAEEDYRLHPESYEE
jgi:hypothetical protein